MLKSSLLFLVFFASLHAAIMADVVSPSKVDISFITIGDPGNHKNPRTKRSAVKTAFCLAQKPIMASQYLAMLNAVAKKDPLGLYNESMGDDLNENACIKQNTDSEGNYYYTLKDDQDAPMTSLTVLDAARFCNWMSHDQPAGEEGPNTTETGSYTLNSEKVLRYMPDQKYFLPLNPGSKWFLPTEDQLEKALYYQGNDMGSYVDKLICEGKNHRHLVTHYGIFKIGASYEWTSTHSLQPGTNNYAKPLPLVIFKWSDEGTDESLEPLFQVSDGCNDNLGFRLGKTAEQEN